MARRFPHHVDVEELVGAGSLGLADAFTRRGGMPGSEFEAFAAYRVRGAIFDELRRLDSMPRHSRRSAKSIAAARRAVEQDLGRPATEEEMAAELGLGVDAYQALLAKIDGTRAPITLGAFRDEDDETGQDIADPADEGPDALAARAQIDQRLAESVSALPERTRVVLAGIYVDGTTLKEIGRSLGVSESRVCQIHAEALAALRLTLGSDDS